MEKYKLMHTQWQRGHPTFFYTHVLWNVGVFAACFVLFTLFFSAVNLFHNIATEMMYSVGVSLQLTYLLYRDCIFSDSTMNEAHHYDDFFFLSIMISMYLTIQTVLFFIFISIVNLHNFTSPTMFLVLYFVLCAIYLAVDIRFFYLLHHNERWAALILRKSKTDKYALFLDELRRRNESKTQAFFDECYQLDSTTSVEDLANAFSSSI